MRDSLPRLFYGVGLALMAGWVLVIARPIILPVMASIIVAYVVLGLAELIGRVPGLGNIPPALRYALAVGGCLAGGGGDALADRRKLRRGGDAAAAIPGRSPRHDPARRGAARHRRRAGLADAAPGRAAAYRPATADAGLGGVGGLDRRHLRGGADLCGVHPGREAGVRGQDRAAVGRAGEGGADPGAGRGHQQPDRHLPGHEDADQRHAGRRELPGPARVRDRVRRVLGGADRALQLRALLRRRSSGWRCRACSPSCSSGISGKSLFSFWPCACRRWRSATSSSPG